MFACRWFEVVVMVSIVAKTAHSSVGQKVPLEVSGDFSQADVELLLNAQTILRRHFIKSLADVRGKRIGAAEGLDGVVGGIIQGLQTRNLDPFKLLRYSNSSEEQLPSALNDLQGGSHGPLFIDWSFFLQTNGRPDIQLRPEQLQKIHELGEPFVDFVLRGIHKNDIKANGKLLADVLYNFRFGEHTPELRVFLEKVSQILPEENLLDFHADAAEGKHPVDVLADILKFIPLKKPSHVRLVHLINQLLSAVSGSVQVKDTSELWRLFDLMLPDDYPPDVIQAKNILSSAIRNNQVDLSGVIENVKGNPPMEKLLMLMAELSGLSSFQREVHAVYPHVKLRYLTSKGRFFRPRTVMDVTFLLNSFLTVQSPTILEEVERIFVLSHWEEVLMKFDFSRYSSPRPLVVDMVQGLLNESNQLPLCSVIVLRYFLTNHRQVSRCTVDVVGKESITPSAQPFQDNHPRNVPVQAPPSSSPSSATPSTTIIASPSRPPDPEDLNQLSSSVSLPPSTTTILPFSSHSSQLLLSMTDNILSMSVPSVGTTLPDSPTASPSPSPSESPESSADSQCQPPTVKNTLDATLLPLRRLDNTTPTDSVEEEFTSATEIQSATAITRLSTAMEHNETTSATIRQNEKTSDEYLTSGTSDYEGETTSPENSGATT